MGGNIDNAFQLLVLGLKLLHQTITFKLCLLPLGNINKDPDQTGQLACQAIVGRLVYNNRMGIPVGIRKIYFILLQTSGSKKLVILFPMKGGNPGLIECIRSPADQLFTGNPKGFPKGLVTSLILPLGILEINRVGNGIHQGL